MHAAKGYLGVAQFGSVLEWGSRGRRFESFHPDHKSSKSLRFRAFALGGAKLVALANFKTLERIGSSINGKRQI